MTIKLQTLADLYFYALPICFLKKKKKKIEIKNVLFKKFDPKENPLDIKLFFLRIPQEATVLTFALKRIILSKVSVQINISLILALV